MLASIVGLVIGFQANSYDIPPKQRSRQGFVKRFAELVRDRDSVSVEEIIRELGEPDVRTKGTEEEEEVWRYGCVQGKGLATLTQFRVKGGRLRIEKEWPTWDLDLGVRGEVIPDGLIPERELRGLLQLVHQSFGDQGFDLLGRIKCANKLRRLGRDKAAWVLREYCRVDWFCHESPMMLLVETLFTARADDSCTDCLRPGRIPFGRLLWVKAVPFWHPMGGMAPGPSEILLVHSWLPLHASHLVLRDQEIVPPVDPFTLVGALQAVHSKEDADGMLRDIRRQVMSLVRSVYVPEREGDGDVTEAEFVRFHREFLRLRARWDRLRQEYVASALD